MNTRQVGMVGKLFVSSLLLLMSVPLSYIGCGTAGNPTSSSSGGGTGTSGTSGVAITGSVVVPQSTSTSVSVGSSVSRGVSKSVAKGGDAENRIIVYKAVSEIPATSGTVTCKKLDGTVLDTGVIASDGSISGVIVDPTQVDSTSQVLLEAAVGTRKITSLVDLTGKATGQTASAGIVNTDSTLSVQQVYYQGDPNCTPDNPSACAAKFVSGEIKPKALFKVFKNACEDSSTSAGSSDAASSSKAVCQAFRAAMAAAPVSFSEMNTAFQDPNILSQWGANDSSLAGIPWSTAHGNFQKFGPAIVKTFEDSTTYSKYDTAGDTGWQSSFKYFGGMTGTELQNGVDHPAVFQNYMGKNATAYNNGDTTAFNAMKQPGVARLIGGMAGKFSGTFDDGKWEAMKTMMDSQASKFTCTDSTTCAQQGEALFNQLASATSTTALDALKASPGTFIDKWVAHPDAYTGTAGQTIFNNQFTTYVQNPTGFTDAHAIGCSVDADCPSAAPTCTPIKVCMSACTSSCGFGSKCTTNVNCATNYCSSDGLCSMNPTLVTAGGGSMFTQMHGPGGSCNFTYECYPPLTCSSGTCSGFENYGGIQAASGFQQSSAGNGQVILNWTATSGATGYKIYRSSSLSGTYALLVTTTNTTYTNTGLTNGTPYFYKISSYTSMGESALSDAMSATPLAGAAGLLATAGNAQVVLSWSAVSGATGYKIYQSLSSGGTYSLVATVGAVTTSTVTGLTNGVQYYFKLAPVVSSVVGDLTSAVNATPVAPAVPIYLFATGNTNGNLGGRAGADALCATRRTALGLNNNSNCNTTRSFICADYSDGITDMATRYSVPTNRPVRSATGITVASSWNVLVNGAGRPFTFDSSLADAGVTTSSGYWWSGCNSTGLTQLNNCTAWTSASAGASGWNGSPSNTASESFLSIVASPCDALQIVLCVCW
ncbi:MAG: hypothetical protein HY877_09365 [Deltaproteobacteria bacterium]|nr:hypothetical protein [Deltaproteobacteria bacterium]